MFYPYLCPCMYILHFLISNIVALLLSYLSTFPKMIHGFNHEGLLLICFCTEINKTDWVVLDQNDFVKLSADSNIWTVVISNWIPQNLLFANLQYLLKAMQVLLIIYKYVLLLTGYIS